MSLGSSLLLGALDASYSPTVDATHYDPKTQKFYKYGSYDANGNGVGTPIETTPYSQPGWFQRAVSPNARNFSNLNAEIGASPVLAQEAEANRELDPTIGNQTSAARLFAQGGGVQTDANSQLNAIRAQQQINANNLSEATGEGLLNIPMRRALVGDQGLNYQSGQLAGDTALQPQEFYNKGMQMGNDSMLLGGQRAAIPLENQDLYNRSLIGATQSGQGVSDLPITTGSQRLGDIAQNYELSHRPDDMVGTPYMDMVSKFGVTPSGGNLNPYFRPAAAATMQALQRGNYMGTGNTVTDSSGKYTMPVKPGNTTIHPTLGTAYDGKILGQASINGQPDEANQDIIDRHNDAIDAHHKSSQADIDANIAQLKAQKAQLQKEHLSSGLLPTLYHTKDLQPEDIQGTGLLNSMVRGSMNAQNSAISGGKKLIGNGLHWLYNND